ncbi:MAG: hypothetical protein RLY31_548 [Bacteroidota bacterium]|jgi:HSP20 family molecular chaperone IbpA
MFRAKTSNHTFDWMGESFAPLIDRTHFLGRSPLGVPKWNLPAANLRRKEAHLLEMELMVPGFVKEDLRLSVRGDQLIVRGETKVEREPDSRYIVSEFEVRSFERRFRLGAGLSHERISASCADGILRISFTDVAPALQRSSRKVTITD